MRKLGRSADSGWVEWAVQMLVDGHDTPTLRVLAGESAPFNEFEMGSLLDRTLEEFGVPVPETVEDAAIAYTMRWVQQLASHAAEKGPTLSELAELCSELLYPDALLGFYTLHDAFDDLQYQEHSPNRLDATRANIDDIVTQEAREWLAVHGR